MSKFIDVYDDIIYKLENEEKFHFARYGDGEWAIVFKNELFSTHLLKRWGDSLIPFSDVLRKVVESNPKYYFGIQNMAHNLWTKEIDDMIEGLNCVDSDIFHNRSQGDTISDFFDTLSKRNVVIVGPEYLKDIPLFKIYAHIITPEYHVWNEIDSIRGSIENFIKDNVDNKLVFLYSCSIATNIFIDIFSDENITQIDTGSLFDPYVGVNSRKYHVDVLKRVGIPDDKIRIPKNCMGK